VQDLTGDGAGKAVMEIWPKLRASLANSEAFIVSGAKGLWRLPDNSQEWDIDVTQFYGVAFKAKEAL
jgi:hypothetical protein